MIAHTHTVSLSPRKATRTHSKSNFEKSVVVDSLVLKYGIIFQKANRNIFGQTTVKRPNISHNPKNVPPTILKYGQICKIWSQNCQSGNHGRWKGWKVGKPPLYFERKCFLKIFGSLAHYPKGKMPVFPPLRTPMLPRTKNAKLYTKISQIALKMPNNLKQIDGCQFWIVWMSNGQNAMLLWNQVFNYCKKIVHLQKYHLLLYKVLNNKLFELIKYRY